MTGDANKQLTGMRTDLSTNLQQSTATLQAVVREALEPVNGIRADLKPVLANAAALTKDAQDSLDDLYPDVRGLVESTDVAVTQTAQTMQTVREASPQIAAASVSVGKSAAVIADSAAQEAKKLTAPMTRRQKLMVWLELLPRIGLKIL
jgi:methyl-accepting chemotaxis protein